MISVEHGILAWYDYHLHSANGYIAICSSQDSIGFTVDLRWIFVRFMVDLDKFEIQFQAQINSVDL